MTIYDLLLTPLFSSAVPATGRIQQANDILWCASDEDLYDLQMYTPGLLLFVKDFTLDIPEFLIRDNLLSGIVLLCEKTKRVWNAEESQILSHWYSEQIPVVYLPLKIDLKETISCIYSYIYCQRFGLEMEDSWFRMTCYFSNTDKKSFVSVPVVLQHFSGKLRCVTICLEKVDISDSEKNVVRNYLKKKLSLMYAPVISFIEDSKIIVLLSIPNEETINHLKNVMECVLKDLMHMDKACSFHICVGTDVDSVQDLCQSYNTSKILSCTIDSERYQNSIWYYDDIAMLIFMLHEEDSVLYESIKNTLHSLLDSENRLLLLTLQEYLGNGANVLKTAQQLFIHESTLKYRIKKIEDITGRDLRDETDLFSLLSAMWVWSYLENRKK